MRLHSTPLRYPGGKQKLTPFIREIIETNNLSGGAYVEPYAGGAGVAMDLLITGVVSNVYLNDACYPLYCFWRCVIDHPEWLCKRILSASLTVDEWKFQRSILKSKTEVDQKDLGFAMFYLNRCNRSGILTGGLIGGLAQDGEWKMDARFPRNELIRRIELIASRSDAIHLSCMDAEDFMLTQLIDLSDRSLIYCDPPYYEKASGLYLNFYNASDHERVAYFIQNNIVIPWIVSYDNAPQITHYYRNNKGFSYNLQYNAG
ncbi:MAG: DNA adenine methylase, partial [Prosthecobacter sp.]|nr:DNA adenine methylase [Prosthecobacter sp.]